MLDPIQLKHRIGPRRPLPFPSTGKLTMLGYCPKCKQKGMVLFNAPTEHAYPTKCLKCGVQHVIKRNDASLAELQRAGGFTPRQAGIRASQRFGLDATQFYDRQREIQDVGIKRAYSQGLFGRSVDTPLGVKSGF